MHTLDAYRIPFFGLPNHWIYDGFLKWGCPGYPKIIQYQALFMMNHLIKQRRNQETINQPTEQPTSTFIHHQPAALH